jgi:mRNA interferase MazF
MKQGDVYWFRFRAPDKRRPVLILTRNSAISYLTSVTVAQITTTIRGVPSEVALTPGTDGVLEQLIQSLEVQSK